MNSVGELMINLVYLWIILNLVLYGVRITRYIKKNPLTPTRKKTIKGTIRLNFIYAFFALLIGFLLL